MGNGNIYIERDRKRERGRRGGREEENRERESYFKELAHAIMGAGQCLLLVISCHFDDSHSNSVR